MLFLERLKIKSFIVISVLMFSSQIFCMQDEDFDPQMMAAFNKFLKQNKKSHLGGNMSNIMLANMLGNNKNFSPYPMLFDSEDFTVKAAVEKSVKIGLYSGFTQAVQESSHEAFKFIPDIVRKVTGGFKTFCGAIFFKVFARSRPLDWNKLALLNNKIYKLVSPYTQVSLGNFAKEHRAAAIAAEGAKDHNDSWIDMQAEVVQELQFTIQHLNRSLIWYNNKYSAKLGFIRRSAISLHNGLSDASIDQLSFYIGQAVKKLEKLQSIIQAARSLTEVQQKNEQLKRWLNMACEDFKYIAALIDPEMSNGNRGNGKCL